MILAEDVCDGSGGKVLNTENEDGKQSGFGLISTSIVKPGAEGLPLQVPLHLHFEQESCGTVPMCLSQ